MTIVPFHAYKDGFAIGIDDPSMVVIGDITPDYIELPESIQPDGGKKLAVLGRHESKCPLCHVTVGAFTLELDYVVFVCRKDGFVTARKRK